MTRTRYITIRLPDFLHRRFKSALALRGETAQDWLTAQILQLVKEKQLPNEEALQEGGSRVIGAFGTSSGLLEMDMTYAEALKAWRMCNPLWRWRKAQGLTRYKAAPLLGVSASSIQQWEGGTIPTLKRLMKLAAAMGRDWQQLKAEWQRWLAERPRPPGSGQGEAGASGSDGQRH